MTYLLSFDDILSKNFIFSRDCSLTMFTRFTPALLVSSVALAAPTHASTVNGDYSFTQILDGRATSPVFETYQDSLILSDGTVVTTVRRTADGGSAVRVTRPDGSVTDYVAPDGVNYGSASSNLTSLSANDRGQIVVTGFVNFDSSSSERRTSLFLIEPNGETKTLYSAPIFQADGVADPGLLTTLDLEINEAGEVAAVGTARGADGLSRSTVLKITDTDADTPTIDILDQGSPTGIGVTNGDTVTGQIAIDDNGLVAWGRQTGGDSFGQQVWISDGSGSTVAVSVGSGPGSAENTSGASALTNSGFVVTQVLGIGPRDIGTSDITNDDIEDFVSAFTSNRQVNAIDGNEFGQVIALTGVGSRPELILDGDTIRDFGNTSAGLTTNNGQYLNDSGQFVFQNDDNRTVWRADPVGSTVETAILPDSVDGDVNTLSYQLVNGLGLTAPIFVDPVLASAFDYQLLGASPLFTSLLIPEQGLGGDGLFDISFGGITQTLGTGQTLDFTSFFSDGISAFRIGGIEQSSGIETDDPFIVGLTHFYLGAVDLTITGIPFSEEEGPAVVPLPSASFLLIGGVGALSGLRRRRKRSQIS